MLSETKGDPLLNYEGDDVHFYDGHNTVRGPVLSISLRSHCIEEESKPQSLVRPRVHRVRVWYRWLDITNCDFVFADQRDQRGN